METNIEFDISKSDVYNEVAKTTAYVGAKMPLADGGEDNYKRIFATEADEEMLEQFWLEAQGEVCRALIRVIGSEAMANGVYHMSLHVSSAFDPALKESMGKSLRNYFVKSITAKWFALANKGDVEEYEAQARSLLEDVRCKAFYKRKPTRPTYN